MRNTIVLQLGRNQATLPRPLCRAAVELPKAAEELPRAAVEFPRAAVELPRAADGS